MNKTDGKLTESNADKAEVLNKFFSSVFTTENMENIPVFPSQTESVLESILVTEKMMLDKLKSLNTSKSEGPDGMHPRLLKELADILSFPLKILLKNLSTFISRFPGRPDTMMTRF